MSGPRTKRPFAGDASDPAQRQITSFFCRSSLDGSSPPASPTCASAFSTSPGSALPATIQANLLSVGMRVRKSVPEGYKTGSAYGSFALWSDADVDADTDTAAGPKTGSTLSSRHELLPFCGIHKIGGLSAQPGSQPTPFPAFVFDKDARIVDDYNEVPGLTSSQDSISTTTTTTSSLGGTGSFGRDAVMIAVTPATTNRKRLYAEDDEPVSHPRPWRDAWLDGEVSPRTIMPPEGWDGASRRMLAVPRRRGAAGGQQHHPQQHYQNQQFLDVDHGYSLDLGKRRGAVGQENIETVLDGDRHMDRDDDFGEAEFLDFRLPEVEMGGV